MKILFLTNYPSPYRVEFFNELGKLCDLTVLFEEDIHKQTHRNSEWFIHNYDNFNAVFMKENKIFNKSICLEVTKYICDSSYDFIIVGNYSTYTGIYSILQMKLRSIKFYIEADGGVAKSGKGIKENFKRLLISSAEGWFSTSKETDNYFLQYGADIKRIYRYPFTSLKNDAILSKIYSQEQKVKLKKELGIDEKLTVITVGSFINRKGIDILIDSWNGIDDKYQLYIIGGGPEETNYREQIDKLKLRNIHLLPFLKFSELAKYYCASDLFVFPTREDIWGLVINEAMSYGLPVITTNMCVSGIELVEDKKNGYVVDLNPNNIREKIVEILEDDSLRRLMGENNIQRMSEYTIENMADTHYKIFNKILEERYKS